MILAFKFYNLEKTADYDPRAGKIAAYLSIWNDSGRRDHAEIEIGTCDGIQNFYFQAENPEVGDIFDQAYCLEPESTIKGL